MKKFDLIKKNKKGSIDLIVILIVLFCIGIMGIFFNYAFNQALTEVQHTELNNTPEGANSLVVAKSTTAYYDYFFLIVFIAVTIGLLVSSFYVDIHPAFFIFFLIVWVLAIVLAGLLGNAFYQVTNTSEISQTTQQFNYTRNIWLNMPIIIAVIGLLAIIIIYAKTRSGVPY